MQFEAELKKLNKAQREAVDTIEGPVMVVAGPGTGKTQVLTLRIANIIKQTDTPPESILALTFTESAVAAMRKRLVEVMSVSTRSTARRDVGGEAYRVSIKTIHGFCNDIIQDYPEEFSASYLMRASTNSSVHLATHIAISEISLVRSAT